MDSMLVKLDACFNPTPSPSFYFDFNGPFVRCHSYTLLMVSGECILRMRLRQLFMKVWTFLVVFLAVLHVSDTYGRTDLTLELKILILVWVAIDRHSICFLSWRKATIALPIRALTSASVPPSLFTMLPRYVKVSTSSSPFPQSMIGQCLLSGDCSCLYVSSVQPVLKWFLSLRSSLACVDGCVIGEQDHLQSLGHPIVSTLSIGFRSFSQQLWVS